jgi:hypothetical protein
LVRHLQRQQNGDARGSSKPIAVALIDVDGDGVKDVLVLNQGTGTAQASSDESAASWNRTQFN